MSRLSLPLVLLLAAVPAFAAPIPKSAPKDSISLKDQINVKLDENLHSEAYANNNLKALKSGSQKLEGITYEIGEGVVQLGSSNVKEKPEKVEGIKVGRTAAKLQFLQGTGYSGTDGAVIGKYVVHYADKSTVDIEIVYGKHVVDWWAYPDKPAPTDAKVAWEGDNEAAKEFKAKIKLYQMEWTNPNPEKEIVSLDFVATDIAQSSAPFCVAITVEAAKAEAKKDDKKEKAEKKEEKKP